jgi:CTP synthase
MVYQHVIEQERNLKYGGKCVEAIPHIRDEITRRIKKAAEHNGSTISVIEIGGTIGDYQNIMFIEAARVMKVENPDDVIFIMVSYLPIPSKVGEMKTKPTQNAVRSLNSYGVQPNMIMARSEVALDERRKEKIAISCNVRPEHVISAPDIESIYEVPLNFEKDKLSDMLLDLLKVKDGKQSADLAKWKAFVGNLKGLTDEVNIAIVGKYFDTGDFVLSDAYISVIEAIKFSSYESGVKPVIHWVNAKDFESGKKKLSELGDYDGIIVPGGFGETGIEGKVSVIQYARENKIPYFGLCYGMQLAVIEYGRNVLGMDGAHTREIEKDATVPVIDIMESQKKNIEEEKYGGTMRLGAYPAVLKEGTIAREAYLSAGALAKEDGESEISERHRHRYEVNPEYIKQFEDGGLVFSGTSPDGILMEIAELPKEKHPFFLGTQFHPEFHARPLDPHPLFTAFIKAAISGKK